MSFSLLYIDPGTGSMLFSVFIGIAAAASFGLRLGVLASATKSRTSGSFLFLA